MTPCFYCGEKIYGIPDQMYGHPICSGRCVAIHDALKKHKEHLEMTDLTKNTSAFGLMDKADQDALMALPNEMVQWYDGDSGWKSKVAGYWFGKAIIYRQKPEPPKPVVEMHKGECWAEVINGSSPMLWDDMKRRGVKSTYTQTTVNGKFARCVITAEGYTPTLTDEQAREVAKISLCAGEKDNISEVFIGRVHELFAAFVKAGVM